MPIRYISLLLLTVLSLSGYAQQQAGSVRGYVKNFDDGEPVMFTLVALKDTKLSATTDEKGYFSIYPVPPGDYEVIVISVEHQAYTEKIRVDAGKNVTLTVQLKKGDRELTEFELNAEREAAQTEVRMSVTPATKRDIQAVPVVGGTKDLINYITAAVPGAITTGDQGGQLYVRGGSPIQNKVLLDGMIVYNPFHSIGFFSVFDTDIIRTADIYTGGFSAEYGGRISSIMDIRTRDGNQNEFGGKLDVNPFGSKLMLEGPLWNQLEKGGSVGTFVLSGKSSYLKQSSKALYPYINRDSIDSDGDGINDKDTLIGLPFNFNDIFGKFSIQGKSGSKINLFGFYFDDRVRYQAISDLNWKSWGVGANFTLLPSGSRTLIEGDASYSDYRIQLLEEELAPRYSDVDGFNLGFDFTYFVKKSEIKYGIDLQGFQTNFATFNSVGREVKQQEYTTEISGYVKYRAVSTRLVLEPSFRMHYYVSLSTISPEPRIGIKYNVNEKIRIKAAAGIYSQNLISAVSDRDVVNLFYGFLSGPDNLQDELVNQDGSVKELRHALQKANHYILGVEYDLGKKLTLNVEGYFKQFTQLTNLNRNKVFDESDNSKPDVLKKDFIVETGNAFGADVMLKYKSDKLYFWAIYSIAKVDRWDGIQEYRPVFDRRHNVNLVATYMFGKDNVWEVNGRWNFGSGFPFTQTGGYYLQEDFSDGIGTDYVSQNGGLQTIYAGLNQGVLPTYHRFDLTMTRNFIIYRPAAENEPKKIRHKIQMLLGVTNAYNRGNVFYVNRVTNETVRQLPIMPSLGVNWEF
jgi:hypothetical protein